MVSDDDDTPMEELTLSMNYRHQRRRHFRTHLENMSSSSRNSTEEPWIPPHDFDDNDEEIAEMNEQVSNLGMQNVGERNNEFMITLHENIDNLRVTSPDISRVFGMVVTDTFTTHDSMETIAQGLSRLNYCFGESLDNDKDSCEMVLVVNDHNHSNESIFTDLYKKIMMISNNLKRWCPTDFWTSEVGVMMSKMMQRLRFLKLMADCSNHMHRIGNSSVPDMLITTNGLVEDEADDNKITDVDMLVDFYLLKCELESLRKLDGDLYRPVYTEGDDQFTRYFEPYMTIEKYCYNALHPVSLNRKEYRKMIKNPATAPHVIKTLTNYPHNSLPELHVCEHLFSFDNGVYDIEAQIFYTFDGTTDIDGYEIGDIPGFDVQPINQLNDSLVSCAYHKTTFRYKDMIRETQGNPGMNIMNVDMPPIKKVLADQGYSLVDMLWILAVLGRALFPVNSADRWGFSAIFLGVGGAGKSTLFTLLMRVIQNLARVGIINNKGQQIFGCQGLDDKRVCIGMDIDEQVCCISSCSYVFTFEFSCCI